jgi:hypothetical protein
MKQIIVSSVPAVPVLLWRVKMSNEAKVTVVTSPVAVQQALSSYEQLLDQFFDADKKASASVADVSKLLINLAHKDPSVKNRWLLKTTRTGNKEATAFFTWARDTAINRAKSRGEKNPNQKWKRIHDTAKEMEGLVVAKDGSAKTEFKFLEEFARGIQNHLFKTDEGQCHATKQLWDRMQEAFIEDGLLKEDA